MHENSALKSDIASLEQNLRCKDNEIEKLNEMIKDLRDEIEKLEQVRDNTKQDNSDLNDKIIQLEEQLYESKQV